MPDSHRLPAAPTMDAGAPSLGPPLSVRQVAHLIGCSVWTVRHTLMPQGLPCFRTGPNSKLIFYREQVVRWLEARQQEGGEMTKRVAQMRSLLARARGGPGGFP